MDPASTTTTMTCPYCAAPASGRFCSACGKELVVHTSSRKLAQEIFGLKAPSVQGIANTAWLAVARPASLSTRWLAGDRQGLTSPIAMMSTVTALSAFVGLILAMKLGQAGAPAAPYTLKMGDVISVAPFLKGWFPAACARAMADPASFSGAFKQIGSWLAAFWPALLILPGWLAFAPWKRVASHGAIVIALVEAIFILIVSGVYTTLNTLAGPGGLGGLLSTAFGIGAWTHTAFHVRHALGTGWGYAIARPLLATLTFMLLIYAWIVGVLILTLMLLPLVSG